MSACECSWCHGTKLMNAHGCSLLLMSVPQCLLVIMSAHGHYGAAMSAHKLVSVAP